MAQEENQQVSSPNPGLHEGLVVPLRFPFKGSIDLSMWFNTPTNMVSRAGTPKLKLEYFTRAFEEDRVANRILVLPRPLKGEKHENAAHICIMRGVF